MTTKLTRSPATSPPGIPAIRGPYEDGPETARLMLAIVVLVVIDVCFLPLGVSFDSLRGDEDSLLLGYLAAQLGLAAIWAAFAPYRPRSRFFTVLGICFFLCLPAGGIEEFLLLVPILVASFIPPSILRKLTATHISVTDPVGPPQEKPVLQFKLRQIVIATVVVAVVLGLLRFLLKEERNYGWVPDNLLPNLGQAALLVAITSLITLPCLYITLQVRRFLMCFLLALLYALSLGYVMYIVASSLAKSLAVSETEVNAFVIPFFLIQYLVLLFARFDGYRLRRRSVSMSA